MIECKEVNKKFGTKKVLSNINMRTVNGKITSLIGKNGAGKSTLIGAILDYYQMDSGNITKEGISVMPDADSLYTEISGYEFLNYMCKLKKLATNDQAIQLAKNLNIENDLHKKIKGYSFGMKKKIGFIQACIGDFDTFIFDEPTSGVDEPSAIIMLEVIDELKKSGAAILLTSHNLDELERVSDYIYIIDEGAIVEEGTVESIISSSGDTDNYFYVLVADKAQLVVEKLAEIPNLVAKVMNDHQVSLELIDDDRQLKQILYLLLNNSLSFTEIYKAKTSLRDSVYSEDKEER